MSGQVPPVSDYINENKIRISNSMVLSKGSYSTMFSGLYNGKNIAVKRISLENLLNYYDHEEENLKKLKHENVIPFFDSKDTPEFRLLAFEWAEASLEDYYDDFYTLAMPSKKGSLLQMAKGLHYIHSKGIIHCDLKPSNILISNPLNIRRSTSSDTEPQVYLKIADFGSSKDISSGPFALPSVNVEEQRWMAPETWYEDQVNTRPSRIQEKSYSFPIDVWALGCLFYSLMTKGHHPFGKDFGRIPWNIFMDYPIEIVGKLNKEIPSANHHVYELILEMIKRNPSNRVGISPVIARPETLIANKITNEEIEKSKSTAGAKVQDAKDPKVPETTFENINNQLGYLSTHIGKCTTRMGMLNEFAIRSSLHATCNEEDREVSSLYELVKCFLKATTGDSHEGAIFGACKRISKYLRKNNSEEKFRTWYYTSAICHPGVSKGFLNQLIHKNPLTVEKTNFGTSIG